MAREAGKMIPVTPIIPMAVRLPAWSLWFSLAAVSLGSIALVGWATNTASLKSVIPGLVTMKVNTALSIMLLGVGVAMLNRVGRLQSLVFYGCVLTCLAVSMLTAGEYIFHVNLGLDNLIVTDRGEGTFPGRMAPTTLSYFIFYSISLCLLEQGTGVFAAQVAMGLLIGASMATLGGYLYGAPQMLAHAPYPVVAVNTTLAIVLLAIGALFKQPGNGPMRIMMADTTGGWLARRLIPTAFIVPLTVGLCVVTGQRAGFYGVAFAVALTVSVDIAVMTAVIWSVSSLLSHSDAIRKIAELSAEQNSQLKDNFLATLSHELRTPLMAILGWGVLLSKRDDLDPEIEEGMKVIERNARAQAQIIEDLLDMTRIISGKMHLNLKQVDLREAIADAIQTIRPSAEAKELHLSVMIDPDTPIILCDPDRIQQVAWNLLSNAIKFTPREAWVRISLTRKESQVQFVVQDGGKGIKEEFLPYLFQRFRQADAGTTRKHGGLGLGLSIVRQLVELHGGTVTAESAGEGTGCTFTVLLPIAAAITDISPNENTGALLQSVA